MGLLPWHRLGPESQRGEGVTQAEAERSWPPGLPLTCEEKVTTVVTAETGVWTQEGVTAGFRSPSRLRKPGPVPPMDAPCQFMLSAKADSVPSAEDCPSRVTVRS